MVKVSIILPTYNRAHTIERAINSILTQDYNEFEVIIVDNGSTDNTKELVESFSDARIRYQRFDEKTGPGAARNYGLSKATGQYIAFLDSDDEWLAGKLGIQVRVLEESSETDSLVYTDMWWIPLNHGKIYHVSPKMVPGRLINQQTRFYQAFFLGIQSTLMSRSCIERVGFFREDLNCFEDMEFLIRLQRECVFHHIKQPLVNYYETSGSVSSQQNVELNVRSDLLKIYKDELLEKNRSFYYREKLIVSLFERSGLASYFSKGNRLSFFAWIKSENSPYMRSFQRFWIRVISPLFGGFLSGFAARFAQTDTAKKVDMIAIMAPPNNNRLEKAFELYDRGLAETILMFADNSHEIFSDQTNEANKRKVECLKRDGVLEYLQHSNSEVPTTLTEIRKLYELSEAKQSLIIVTDGFHTRRTRMVVDSLFVEQPNISIIAAQSQKLQCNNWWHSFSAIRTYFTEFTKQLYYRHFLLRR